MWLKFSLLCLFIKYENIIWKISGNINMKNISRKDKKCKQKNKELIKYGIMMNYSYNCEHNDQGIPKK